MKLFHAGKYEIDERQCSEACACQKLQDRARNDPYIFSLAPNPFYLWLICTVSSLVKFRGYKLMDDVILFDSIQNNSYYDISKF